MTWHPLALHVDQLKAGDVCRIYGYHTGDFTAEFIRRTGLNEGEFKVLAADSAELQQGCLIEVPSYMARISLVARAGETVQ